MEQERTRFQNRRKTQRQRLLIGARVQSGEKDRHQKPSNNRTQQSVVAFLSKSGGKPRDKFGKYMDDRGRCDIFGTSKSQNYLDGQEIQVTAGFQGVGLTYVALFKRRAGICLKETII